MSFKSLTVLRKLGKANITRACLSFDLCDKRLLRVRAAGGHTVPAVVTAFCSLSVLLKRIFCRWALHVSSLNRTSSALKDLVRTPSQSIQGKFSFLLDSASSQQLQRSERSFSGLLLPPSNRSVCFLRGCDE